MVSGAPVSDPTRVKQGSEWKRELEALFTATISRLPRPSLVVFKMLLLQHCYGLSDPQCEELGPASERESRRFGGVVGGDEQMVVADKALLEPRAQPVVGRAGHRERHPAARGEEPPVGRTGAEAKPLPLRRSQPDRGRLRPQETQPRLPPRASPRTPPQPARTGVQVRRLELPAMGQPRRCGLIRSRSTGQTGLEQPGRGPGPMLSIACDPQNNPFEAPFSGHPRPPSLPLHRSSTKSPLFTGLTASI